MKSRNNFTVIIENKQKSGISNTHYPLLDRALAFVSEIERLVFKTKNQHIRKLPMSCNQHDIAIYMVYTAQEDLYKVTVRRVPHTKERSRNMN